MQTLKDDAIKVLHSMCQQTWKTQQRPQDWERLTLIPVPKKGSTKECTINQTIALISHAVWITTNWKVLKEMGMPDHLTCLL